MSFAIELENGDDWNSNEVKLTSYIFKYFIKSNLMSQYLWDKCWDC